MTGRRAFVNGSTPTVLLVHDAFTDASSWAGVIAELHQAGIGVMAPANPLRGLASDASYLAGTVGTIDGPVVLVGHSYGGVVITQAGALVDNIVGLVYVAALALAEGESILDLTGRYPDTLLSRALRPASFPLGEAGRGVELYLTTDRYRAVIAADLPEHLAAVAAVTQRPVAVAAFEEGPTVAAWRSLPSWFVIATADQAIHPDAQRFTADRAGADTIEVDASHSITRSRPAAVAEHIRAAAISARAPNGT
jgi:pimeloyl-ACP methyl ester carboxylesterase